MKNELVLEVVLAWLPLNCLACSVFFFLFPLLGKILCVLSNEEVKLLFVCSEYFIKDVKCNEQRRVQW